MLKHYIFTMPSKFSTLLKTMIRVIYHNYTDLSFMSLSNINKIIHKKFNVTNNNDRQIGLCQKMF